MIDARKTASKDLKGASLELVQHATVFQPLLSPLPSSSGLQCQYLLPSTSYYCTIMTDKLPPNLLALFAARPALRYLPPSDHAPEERKTANISGVAQFLPAMEEYEKMDYKPTESWLERKLRVKAEKREKQEKVFTEGFSQRMRSRPPFICYLYWGSCRPVR